MKLYEITFSPTGGTQKAAQILTQGLAEGAPVQPVDLTDPAGRFSEYAPGPEDLAVIAVPSYGGRVPQAALERLEKIRPDRTPAVLVCVYGNRAYEDTLAELEDTARRAGFEILAGVAALAEHSILRQYAAGRPDEADKTRLLEFAAQIRQKRQAGEKAAPALPGNRPYRKRGGVGMVPKPDDRCTGCGECARRCPVGAIDLDDPQKTDAAACISCMRCVSVCPQQARRVNGVALAAAALALKKACSQRKECELYL